MAAIRPSRTIGLALAVVAAVAGGVIAAPPPTSAAPAQGPPDSPTTDVAVTVTADCPGWGGVDFEVLATVPTSVRAGRPFPVRITVGGFPSGATESAFVGLAITGGTKTEATFSPGGTGYFVAAGASGTRTFGLSVTRLGFLDGFQFIDVTCTPIAPVPLVTLPVRHSAPFAGGNITATQTVGLFCITLPGGYPSAETDSVAVTVPNQARVGEPFPIDGPGDVSGGVRSGDTVTPTGEVGDTVEVTYDGSYQLTFPPPFPPLPYHTCGQRGGPVHLASIPIVAR
jgi:hypothetical protein